MFNGQQIQQVMKSDTCYPHLHLQIYGNAFFSTPSQAFHEVFWNTGDEMHFVLQQNENLMPN